MDRKTIFSMQSVGKVLTNGTKILDNISLSFFYGAKIGVLGANGAGKSTLLKIIAGVDQDYIGDISFEKKISFGFLTQEPELDQEQTVKSALDEGLSYLKGVLKDFENVSMQLGSCSDDDEMNRLFAQQSKLQDIIESANAWELDYKIEKAAAGLKLPAMDKKIKVLSGGERRRVALCRLILSEPDVLLLDEPTNHLDAESVHWLEKFLDDFAGTVIAVTHDRYFLDNVAGWILELDRGRGIPYQGNYTDWLIAKQKRLEQEDKKELARQKSIERELEWVRSSARGRQKKSKSRLSHYQELVSQNYQKQQEKLQIYIPMKDRLGEDVIHIDNVSKKYEDKVLVENFSAKIPRAAIVGIIGPNGAGKTTFFNMITKKEKSDAGVIKIGQTVKFAHVGQFRDSLDSKKTVWQEISDNLDNIMVGNYVIPSRAYVSRFNFKGSDQQKLVGDLSGGERNRLHLAKLLKEGANVLLLDEPSNDLDVETLRALEEAILSFAGTVLVISHDRWFLDRVATHMLVFDGNGSVKWFEGNYSEYEKYMSDMRA